jgi:threonylcarbamoyladenosine tRNA methylthiotransferase MtaB
VRNVERAPSPAAFDFSCSSVERTLLSAAFDFALDLASLGCPLSFGEKWGFPRTPPAVRYHTQVSRYYIENFGCRATQADGAAIERQFEEQGMSRASTAAQASVVVMNTCTVTANADQDARAAIRRVRRQNPEAQIVVTGCYAQRAPQEIAALPGVSLVIGNSHKHQLAEIVTAAVVDPTLHPERRSASTFSRRTGIPATAQNECPVINREAASDRSPEFALSLSKGRKPWEGTEKAPAPAERKSIRHPDSLFPAETEEALSPSFVPLAVLTTASRQPEAGTQIFVSDIFAHTELLAAPVFDAANERTRPNLKVQDGCDNRCSFCVIPFVRGQSRSLPIDRIVNEVNGLVASGYREVVISGINLGRWGRDLNGLPTPGTNSDDAVRKPKAESRKPDLPSLIRAILRETALEKLRISSVEPMDWTDDLISLVASSARIAKHAHVPMQSASDAVLRRMHRKYRPWHYREKIEKIRAAMPTAAIGADVMVGFPGETDAEFEATRRMIEDLPFTYLHVFTYSARPGTPATAMPNQVPIHQARERNKVLRELASEKKLAFMRTFIGEEVAAITLNVVGTDSAGEFTEALTDNYLKLRLHGRHDPNCWLNARIEDVKDGVLVGSTFESAQP